MEHSDVSWLLERLAPLCEPLHGSLADAAQVAREHLAPFDMVGGDTSWITTHLTRAHALRLLGDEGVPEGWSMRNQRQNGRFELRLQGVVLRMLHDPHAVVPAPGSNFARRAYYENQRYMIFKDVEMSNLLGLWNFDAETGAAAIRVVRTVGSWNFKDTAKIDLSFWLPDDSAEMDGLRFDVTDEGLELEIPEDDTGEEGEADAGPVRG